MGAFGQNEFGSPLGAIDPEKIFNFSGLGFYSYSGFSSRDGALGISGFSMAAAVAACQSPGIELVPWGPTLIFPMNYDVVSGRTAIVWREAIPPDACGDEVAYELQITSSFSRDEGWRTIASDLEFGTTSFTVDFGNIPFTEDAGIRVRAKDTKGIYSTWSQSLNPFTIANHPPNPVRIVHPRDTAEVFDDSLVVMWEEPEIADLDGHEVTYLVEVTTDFGSDRGWTPVPGGAVPRGINSHVINTFDFPEGSNYGVRVVPVDSLSAKGRPAKVRFVVRHEGNFVIDTLPPFGRIIINDGDALTADPRVKLDLLADDLTTGIKDFRLRNADEDCFSDWEPFIPQKFWDLSTPDGLKRVLVQFRDFAENISGECDCEIISRILCGTGNATDLQSSPDKLFISFSEEGAIKGYTAVARDEATLAQSDVSALAFLDKDLYAAGFDETANSTTIHRVRGSEATSVATLTGKVLSMIGFQSGLFVGLDTGFIKEVLGSGVQHPPIGETPLSPVTRLRISNGVLVALAGRQYITHNGSVFEENTF